MEQLEGVARLGPILGDGDTAGWLVTIWDRDGVQSVVYHGLYEKDRAGRDYLDARAEGLHAQFFALRRHSQPAIELWPTGEVEDAQT